MEQLKDAESLIGETVRIWALVSHITTLHHRSLNE